MYGQILRLPSLLANSNKSSRLVVIKKIVEALRVQLVILVSTFVAGSTLWLVSCLPHVALCHQLFVEMGAHAPVPSRVSDILMVNPGGVIDIFCLYTRLTSRLNFLL